MSELDEAIEAAEAAYNEAVAHFKETASWNGICAAIATYRAARLAQGWREVPREPTEKQRKAASWARMLCEDGECEYVAVIRAAWDSAPDPEQKETTT